jgi:hypothetical protein
MEAVADSHRFSYVAAQLRPNARNARSARFASGMRNFLGIDRHRATLWQWFDHSGPRPRLIAEGANQ